MSKNNDIELYAIMKHYGQNFKTYSGIECIESIAEPNCNGIRFYLSNNIGVHQSHTFSFPTVRKMLLGTGGLELALEELTNDIEEEE